jgi:hypothetical protein
MRYEWNILLLVLSCTGYIGQLAALRSVGLHKAPFIFCCFVSLVLYSFALLGTLETGLRFAVVLGLLLFVWRLWQLSQSIRCTASLKSDLLLARPLRDVAKLLYAIPFVVLYISIDAKFKFLLWDEFSYWASSAKIIFETNALFHNESPIFFKSYPPLQQLFQYYFTKLTFWSEKNVLYAQIFWVLSALLCIAGVFAKKSSHVAVVFLTSVGFLYFFEYSYSTIYSDPLLGVCFGASLALAFDQDGSKSKILLFFLSIAALLLLKEIAILLALVAIAVFVISLFRSQANTLTTRREAYLITIKSVSTVALGLLAVAQSWAWYVAKIQGSRELAANSLQTLFKPAMQLRLEQTSTEFVARLFKSGYVHLANQVSLYRPSIIVLCAGLILVSCLLIYCRKKNERLTLSLNVLIITMGAAGYAAALFLSYLLVFTEYEGVRLASFERYLSSYILAWLLITYALTAAAIEAQPKLRAWLSQLIVGFVLFLCFPNIYFKDLRKIASEGPALVVRESTEAFAAQLKPSLQTGDKIYFIAQASNGLERTMFYYAMLPFTTSTSWCWSIGPKYFDGDVWTCNTRLQELLKGFDYLALFNGDRQFWDQERAIFDSVSGDKTAGLFKIHRIDGNITHLSFVPPQAK